MKRALSKRSAQLVALATVLAGLAAGVAYGAIPTSGSGVINGCYEKRIGILRVIDNEAGKRCTSLETPISWNQQGVKGEQGLQGLRGEKGEQGDSGEQGLQGIQGERGPQGLPGSDGAQGPPGPPGSISGLEVSFKQSANAAEGVGVASAAAQCPDGKHVLGGGYVVQSSVGGLGAKVMANSPSSTGGPASAWLVTANNPEKVGGWFLVAYAICA